MAPPHVTIVDNGSGVGAVASLAAIAAGGVNTPAHRREFTFVASTDTRPYTVTLTGSPGRMLSPTVTVTSTSANVAPTAVITLGVNQSTTMTGTALASVISGDTTGTVSVAVTGATTTTTELLMVPGTISITPTSATTLCTDEPQSFQIGLAFNRVAIDGHALALSISNVQPATATVAPTSAALVSPTTVSTGVPFSYIASGASSFLVSIADGSVYPMPSLTGIAFHRDLPPALTWTTTPPACVRPGDSPAATVSATDAEGSAIDVSWLLDGLPTGAGPSVRIDSITTAGAHILTASAREDGACRQTSQLRWSFTVRPADPIASPYTIAAGGVPNPAHLATVSVSGCPDSTVSIALVGGYGVNASALLSLPGANLGPGQTTTVSLGASGTLTGSLLSPDLGQTVTLKTDPGGGVAAVRCQAPALEIAAGQPSFSPSSMGFTVPLTVSLSLNGMPVASHEIALRTQQLGLGCGGAQPLQITPPQGGLTDAQGQLTAAVTGSGAVAFDVIASDQTAYVTRSTHNTATSGRVNAMLADEVLLASAGGPTTPPIVATTTLLVGDTLTLKAIPANSGPDCAHNTADDIVLGPGSLVDPTWRVDGNPNTVTPTQGSGPTLTITALNEGDATVMCTGYNLAQQKIVSVPFSVKVRKLAVTMATGNASIDVGGTTMIQVVATPGGGNLSLPLGVVGTLSIDEIATTQTQDRIETQLRAFGLTPGPTSLIASYSLSGHTAFSNSLTILVREKGKMGTAQVLDVQREVEQRIIMPPAVAAVAGLAGVHARRAALDGVQVSRVGLSLRAPGDGPTEPFGNAFYSPDPKLSDKSVDVELAIANGAVNVEVLGSVVQHHNLPFVGPDHVIHTDVFQPGTPSMFVPMNEILSKLGPNPAMDISMLRVYQVEKGGLTGPLAQIRLTPKPNLIRITADAPDPRTGNLANPTEITTFAQTFAGGGNLQVAPVGGPIVLATQSPISMGVYFDPGTPANYSDDIAIPGQTVQLDASRTAGTLVLDKGRQTVIERTSAAGLAATGVTAASTITLPADFNDNNQWDAALQLVEKRTAVRGSVVAGFQPNNVPASLNGPPDNAPPMASNERDPLTTREDLTDVTDEPSGLLAPLSPTTLRNVLTAGPFYSSYPDSSLADSFPVAASTFPVGELMFNIAPAPAIPPVMAPREIHFSVTAEATAVLAGIPLRTQGNNVTDILSAAALMAHRVWQPRGVKVVYDPTPDQLPTTSLQNYANVLIMSARQLSIDRQNFEIARPDFKDELDDALQASPKTLPSGTRPTTLKGLTITGAPYPSLVNTNVAIFTPSGTTQSVDVGSVIPAEGFKFQQDQRTTYASAEALGNFIGNTLAHEAGHQMGFTRPWLFSGSDAQRQGDHVPYRRNRLTYILFRKQLMIRGPLVDATAVVSEPLGFDALERSYLGVILHGTP